MDNEKLRELAQEGAAEWRDTDYYSICPTCEGLGRIDDGEPCPDCDGEGWNEI